MVVKLFIEDVCVTEGDDKKHVKLCLSLWKVKAYMPSTEICLFSTKQSYVDRLNTVILPVHISNPRYFSAQPFICLVIFTSRIVSFPLSC